MVSVCLPSNALLQHLPSYLGFSYLGRGVSLHGCSSKAQPLLLSLDKGYLLSATLPDLQCGIAPLGPPALAQPLLLRHGVPKSDVRGGGQEELPRIQGQGRWPGGATPCPRPGAAAGRTNPMSITSYQSKWPPSKRLQVINVEENMEKRKASFSVGGNVNRAATMENSMLSRFSRVRLCATP